MSKKGKIGKIEKKIGKKIEVLSNMSKIGKKCQDCVTDWRGSNMSKKGKIGKIEKKIEKKKWGPRYYE